jgi:transposase
MWGDKYFFMTRQAYINTDHGTVKEIHERIKKLEKDTKVLNKLYFINDIYHESTITETCEKLGITKVTGHKWLNEWNKYGFDSLKRKKGSGGKSKLSSNEKKLLEESIISNQFKSTKEVRNFVFDEFGVEYSIRQIERILRELKFNYGKPYPIFSKMPDDGEEQLKKNSKKLV